MQQKIRLFQHKIFSYYEQHGRDLPWRQTSDPYKIWLSEVMLQQTQVERVKDYWTRWLKKWPTVHDLADAQRRDVLQMWSGLGYNNRAVNLHKAAQKIVADYGGSVVTAAKNYKHVPGIGPYTAAAIQIFSRNADIATVDTNIRRILIHEFSLSETTTDKQLWSLARECLPLGKSKDWHNALMDFGATHLTARKSGIRPKTRQSKFEGSDRQIRSRILKHLLNYEDGVTFEVLQEVSKESDTKRMEKIIDTMLKDDLIQEKKERYYLVD